MIKVMVHLSNDVDSKYDEVEITKAELLQLACNKARGNYMDGYYTTIRAENEIIVTSKT